MSDLATASASAQLSNQTGRAILSARGNHVAVDSTPPLGGPNETINPIDLLLGALATCGVFLCETTARDEGITLDDVTAEATGSFDPKGIKTDDIDPHIQRFTVTITVSGPNQEQAARLEAGFRSKCPIFTTLVKAAPIDLEMVVR